MRVLIALMLLCSCVQAQSLRHVMRRAGVIAQYPSLYATANLMLLNADGSKGIGTETYTGAPIVTNGVATFENWYSGAPTEYMNGVITNDAGSSYSLSIWFKFDLYSQYLSTSDYPYYTIIGSDTYSSGSSRWKLACKGGYPTLGYYGVICGIGIRDDNETYYVSSSSELSNKFTHVVLYSKDIGSGKTDLKLWVNGTVRLATNGCPVAYFRNLDYPADFDYIDIASRRWLGDLTMFRYWRNREVTDIEVEELYNYEKDFIP